MPCQMGSCVRLETLQASHCIGLKPEIADSVPVRTKLFTKWISLAIYCVNLDSNCKSGKIHVFCRFVFLLHVQRLILRQILTLITLAEGKNTAWSPWVSSNFHALYINFWSNESRNSSFFSIVLLIVQQFHLPLAVYVWFVMLSN